MTTASPRPAAPRLDHLDTVRGTAVLGIFAMNAVSLGLGSVAYFNVSTPAGPWSVGLGTLGEVLADQKFMGLFSLLFGMSVLLFFERAEAAGKPALRLSVWRNVLLLGIGTLHSLLWEGDVLTLYALCAPVLLAVRHWRTSALLRTGVLVVLASPVLHALYGAWAAPSWLRGYWFVGPGPLGAVTTDVTAVFLMLESSLRALGMMLVGMGLYRATRGGTWFDRAWFARLGLYGIASGTGLAAAGVLWLFAHGFSVHTAVLSNVPNGLATLPMALGYYAALTWWDRRGTGGLRPVLRALGRTALSNYVGQTVVGLVVFTWLLPNPQNRVLVYAVVGATWLVQGALSVWWLRHFRYGPLEWAWRCATHRAWVPLVRSTA